MQGLVELHNVTKRFGSHVVVDAMDLRIEGGEFLSLLGPSGCGKSTTLRMIAGLEQPSEGRLSLDGTDITDLPPHKRAVNTVFQSYALFPHLSVSDNIAYALRLRRAGRREIAAQVRDALEMVRMGDHADYFPRQISGGQQQRVALARAIVARPRVLLLDEPLSALDLKLRQAMRLELKRIHRQLGITFVFVTHDQGEALTMSDRVAVMHEGRVLQLDRPEELYERPASRFVASFIGDANLLDAVVARAEGDCVTVKLGNGELLAKCKLSAITGTAITLSVRPQRVKLLQLSGGAATGATAGPTGVVMEMTFLGDATSAVVRLDESDQQVTAVRLNVEGVSAFGDLQIGDSVQLACEPTAVHALVR